jgi:hypothetical protein
VDSTTLRLLQDGLSEKDVSAIGAGLHDVAQGLEKVLVLLNATDVGGAQNVVEAQFEIDEHLRPHLKALSAALASYRKLLRRRHRRLRGNERTGH